MRVAFNARILADPVIRGWNRYTINLVAQLVSLGVRIFLYTDRPLDPLQAAQLPLDKATLRQAPALSYMLWEQAWLPWQCMLDEVDILHCPVHFGLPQVIRAKCVLTIHDVIDEVYYRTKIRSLTRAQGITALLGWMARRRADRIVTVSGFSRDDIIRHFRMDPSRISSVYLAAEERFQGVGAARIAQVRSRYSLPDRFLFYIGSMEPRKGLSFALEALARLETPDLRLVIGGGSAADRSVFLQRAATLGISERIQVLGFVDDEDLPALYAAAAAFVYPSEYEGFGLQLCEAMKAGCPVLAARASCLPEILGSGGDMFSLNDPSELTAAMQRLQTDPAYSQDLRRRGEERARSFSWKRTAEETLAIYEDLLSASPATAAAASVSS